MMRCGCKVLGRGKRERVVIIMIVRTIKMLMMIMNIRTSEDGFQKKMKMSARTRTTTISYNIK